MSYEIGTDLGRLRELIGDTDPQDELFSDLYLNDLLVVCGNVDAATIRVLRRVAHDPGLLIRRFKKFSGSHGMRPEDLQGYQRMILELIRSMEEAPQVALANDWVPEADSRVAAKSTDENGFYVRTGIDDYLDDQELI